MAELRPSLGRLWPREADGGIASACFAKLILANVADEEFAWRGTVLE